MHYNSIFEELWKNGIDAADRKGILKKESAWLILKLFQAQKELRKYI